MPWPCDLGSWEWWIKHFIKFCGRFGFLPYTWDANENQLKVTESKLQLYLWYLGTTCLLLDNSYLVFTAINLDYSKIAHEDLLKFLVHMISRLGASCGSISIFIRLEFSKDFINHSMIMHRRYKALYFGDPEAQVLEKMVSLIMAGTIVTMIHPIVGPFVQHVTERHNIRYMGSQYLSADVYDSVFGIVFFAGMELWISYIGLSAACYPMAVLYIYCGISKFWLKWLRDRCDKMSMYKTVIMYRTLQVLDVIHNACCADCWWPLTQNMYLYLHVMINVVLVKSHSLIPTSYLLMLVLACVMLTAFEKNCIQSASQLYEFSFEIRQNMMNSGRCKRMVGRSFKSVQAKVAWYYYLKTSTFTTYMQTLVDQTINVVLTFES